MQVAKLFAHNSSIAMLTIFEIVPFAEEIFMLSANSIAQMYTAF